MPALCSNRQLMKEPHPPLVSIVMPSLNQAAYLEAALDSVLSQSYRNLELIVADGGSTDGSLDLLALRQSRDSRLRLLTGPDTGPAQAINKALRQTRGTLIGWLNSDDLYAADAIDRAVATLHDGSDFFMVYGHGQHVDSVGKPIDGYPTLPPSTSIDAFQDGCFICQPTVFFRRTLFLLLGDLDEGLKTAFDFDYWLRAFKSFPGRIGFVDRIQAFSRLHDDCITVRMRRTVTLEGIQVVARHLGHVPAHWLLSYCRFALQQAHANNDPRVEAEIQSAFDSCRDLLSPAELHRARQLLERDPLFVNKQVLSPQQNESFAMQGFREGKL